MANLAWKIGDARITRVVEFEQRQPLSMLLPKSDAVSLSYHRGWNTMKQDNRWAPTLHNARYLFAEMEYNHRKLLP